MFFLDNEDFGRYDVPQNRPIRGLFPLDTCPRKPIPMSEFIVTEANFQADVIDSKVPVMVEFGATWCTPCKILAPIIHELSAEMNDVKIGMLDVDEQSNLAQQYNVMSVPTMLFFKDGKVMDQMVGVQSKDVIKAKLEELKA